MSRKISLFAAALGFAALLFPLAREASAQTYPARPVTLIVPAAAGGPTDTVARLIADAMGRSLGQRVTIGRRLGNARHADGAASAADVLDHHLPAEAAGPGSGHHPCHAGGWPPRGRRHDQRTRTRGIGLRRSLPRKLLGGFIRLPASEIKLLKS